VWLVGICASLFGSEALYLAFVVWIDQLTGSASLAGLAVFAYFAPAVLAPALGYVVDRLPRKALLIGADLAQAIWVCLALFVHSASQVWLLYLVLVGLTLGSALQAPAASALLAGTAEQERLGRLNSVFRTGKDVARTAAPGLGVVIAQAAGPHALIVIDAGTFLLSALCVWQLRTREVRAEVSRRSLWSELAAGAEHVLKIPLLRRLVGTIGVAMAVYGMRQPTLIFAVDHGLHASPQFLGWAATVVNVGAVSGGLLCVRLIDRIGAAPLVRAGLLVLACGAVPLAVPNPVAVLVACFVIGVGGPLTLVGYVTTVLQNTPSHLQGRVLAAGDAAVSTPQGIAAGVGSGILALVPYQAIAIVMAVVVGFCALTLTKARMNASEARPVAAA
jgi:MFS family permease